VKKTEWFAILVLLLILLFMLTGCNTVAGIGKDITGIADVAKEKVTQPKQEPAK
jgi:predicted small secreted protein